MIAPITWANTMISTQISLFPALNIESSGTLTTSTRAQIQTTSAPMEGSGKGTRSPSPSAFVPPRSDLGRSLVGMEELRAYPTEGERALKASLVGAILGLVLATLARRPRLA